MGMLFLRRVAIDLFYIGISSRFHLWDVPGDVQAILHAWEYGGVAVGSQRAEYFTVYLVGYLSKQHVIWLFVNVPNRWVNGAIGTA